MRYYCFAVTAALMPLPAMADHYEFDKAHTRLLFYVDHAGFSDMVGDFTQYDGTFEFDPRKPEASRIDVRLYPSGIRTSSELLDYELQGEDFFNSEAFRDIHFVSTGVTLTGEHTGDVAGDLTMLGVTKPVVLHVRFNKADYHPITHIYTAGFSGQASVKRSDFGMGYLVPMVGDEVTLAMQAEGINLDRKKAEGIRH